MPCYLLHMIEAPSRRPYADPETKDVVGQYPRLFCAQHTPPEELPPGQSVMCLQRDVPCWRDTQVPSETVERSPGDSGI